MGAAAVLWAVVASLQPDVTLRGYRGSVDDVVFSDGVDEVPARLAGMESDWRGSSAPIVVPVRPLRPRTRYAVRVTGQWLRLATVHTGTSGSTRPEWPNAPQLTAENVIAGRRFVAVDATGNVEVVMRCRGGPEETRISAQIMPVTCRLGDDAAEVILRLRDGFQVSLPWSLAIPPRGVLPASAAVDPRPRVRELPPWRPSLPLGLLLFGVVPFALGFGAVIVRRRLALR
jgi:hypothetical protein